MQELIIDNYAMDQFQYLHNRNRAITKHNKKRLTEDQVRLLETNFSSNNKLEPERKSRLALELGVPPRQVAIWYQNKRTRAKTQSLEIDNKVMQLRLDGVVADNERLKGEIQRLAAELSRIRGVQFTSLSSCDDVGSSNLVPGRDSGGGLYGSFAGGGGPFMATDRWQDYVPEFAPGWVFEQH